jgi:hypothetical protein
MTMGSEGRRNQRFECEGGGASGQDLKEMVVGIGLSVNQKTCAKGRETGEKPARIARSVRAISSRGNPG